MSGAVVYSCNGERINSESEEWRVSDGVYLGRSSETGCSRLSGPFGVDGRMRVATMVCVDRCVIGNWQQTKHDWVPWAMGDARKRGNSRPVSSILCKPQPDPLSPSPTTSPPSVRPPPGDTESTVAVVPPSLPFASAYPGQLAQAPLSP